MLNSSEDARWTVFSHCREKAISFLHSLRHDNGNINEAERLQGALSLGVCLMVNM